MVFDRYLIPILALGLALRLWRIDAALWYDETFTAWLASLPMDRLIVAAMHDVHPPFYYILLSIVGYFLGFSEVALRLPSLLAGLVTIYLVYRLAAATFDERIALTAATITAAAPFHVYYSQEVRFYAAQMMFCTLAAVGLIERRRWWLIGGSLAALYVHNMSVFAVGATFLAGWVCPPAPPEGGERVEVPPSGGLGGLRWLVTGALAVAVGYLPGAYIALIQAGNISSGFWIPSPTIGRIFSAFDDFLFFSPQNAFILASGLLTSLALVWIAAAKPWRVRQAVTLIIMAAVPLLAVFFISLVWKPVFISRTVAPAAVPFYILIAWVIGQSPHRLRAWGGAAAVTACIVIIGPIFSPIMGRQPLNEELLSFWGEFQPGDSIFHANLGSYVVWKWYRPEIRQVTWAQQTTLEQSLTTETRRAMGVREDDFERVGCIPEAGRPFSGRWWLIYFHNPTTKKSEVAYIDHLINDYPSRRIKTLTDNPAVDAAVYLIQPCLPE